MSLLVLQTFNASKTNNQKLNKRKIQKKKRNNTTGLDGYVITCFHHSYLWELTKD